VVLQRLDRKDDARALLISLAKSVAASRRRDPAVLFQLADHFAEAGEFLTAMRLVTKANSQLPPIFVNTQRLDRFRMDQRLATSYAEQTSRHFELRYPPDRQQYLARRLAGVLEEEHARIQRWVPLSEPGVIQVHLLPYDDFMEAFGRSIEIIGLFDGRIRLPMADLPLLNREIVAIISHELAHAMIAEATADKAPFWLQEGLAQHAEMRAASANPMPAYAATSGLFSLTALEGILKGFPHPKLVAQAYDQACWTVHFIEAKHGRRALHRLLAAFAQGQTTEQAVETVLGSTVAQLDKALAAWWLNEAPRVWETEARDYRLYADRQLIQRGSRS
jgi:Peptidase MA superfamily